MFRSYEGHLCSGWDPSSQATSVKNCRHVVRHASNISEETTSYVFRMKWRQQEAIMRMGNLKVWLQWLPYSGTWYHEALKRITDASTEHTDSVFRIQEGLCEILVSHGSRYEDYCGLRCDAVWFNTLLPTLRSNLLSPSGEILNWLYLKFLRRWIWKWIYSGIICRVVR
jgi:hypothetical protein